MTDTTAATGMIAERAAMEQDIRRAFEEFEHAFRRNHPYLWLATLLGPFLLTLTILLIIGFTAGLGFVSKLVSLAVVTFLFLGRFVILAGRDGEMSEVGGFMTSEQLFMMVTYNDVMTALLVAFHIGVLFRLPTIGPRISALVADGQYVLKSHPWMRRATFIGMTVFVAFPLAATGSVGGSILGRLLGMSRFATFSATIVGCLLGNSVMYLASDAMNRYVDKNHPVVKYGGITLMVIIISLLEWRYRRMKQQALEHPHPADHSHTTEPSRSEES